MPGIARMNAETDLTVQAVLSFLDGTEAWRSLGETPERNVHLATGSGLLVRAEDAQGRALPLDSVLTSSASLRVRNAATAYAELLPAGTQPVEVRSGAVSFTTSLPLPPRGTRAYTVKPGPWVERVQPAAGPVSPLLVAPGMIVSLYGRNLQGVQVSVAVGAGPETPARVLYTSSNQVNAVLPRELLAPEGSGLFRLTVQSPAGAHRVRVLAEPAVPTLFTQNGAVLALHGVTSAPVTAEDPAQAGEIITLFTTGLGSAEPVVLVGAEACEVTYAGPAPGFDGLDQINCQISASLAATGDVVLSVGAGRRVSRARLPVR